MNWKQSALAAAVGGAFALAPAPAKALTLGVKPAIPAAQPVAADDKKTAEQRLEAIEKQLAGITEALKGKRDSDGYLLASDPGLIADVKKLKDDVRALQNQLAEMKKSTSLRPGGEAPAAADPMAGKGTVRVINDYPVQITIVINEKNSYRVEANTELKIHVAAGEFSYLLLNGSTAAAPTRSTIKEKEVVTLRVK